MPWCVTALGQMTGAVYMYHVNAPANVNELEILMDAGEQHADAIREGRSQEYLAPPFTTEYYEV